MNQNDTTSDQNLRNLSCKGAIFDLDDTLYPKYQFVFSGFRAVSDYVYTLYGFHIYEELVDLYHQGERHKVFVKALRHHFQDVESILNHKLLNVYLSHPPQIQLYPDVRRCMVQLRNRDIRIGLITDGYGGIQRKKVEALGLEQFLESTVYSDDLVGGKASWQPCPDPFYIMSMQMELEFPEIIYIADNPLIDFLAPNSLGLRTIQLVRDDGDYTDKSPPSQEYVPDFTIYSLDEITDVLQSADSEG